MTLSFYYPYPILIPHMRKGFHLFTDLGNNRANFFFGTVVIGDLEIAKLPNPLQMLTPFRMGMGGDRLGNGVVPEKITWAGYPFHFPTLPAALTDLLSP